MNPAHTSITPNTKKNHNTRIWLAITGIALTGLFILDACANSRHRKIEGESQKRSRMESFKDVVNEDGTLKASLENGKITFMEYCRSCHGQDGQRINLGDRENPRYLAHSAIADPERFFEIVNFGDKKKGMIANFEEIAWQDLVDVTAFVQTLPTEAPPEPPIR